MGWTPLDLVTVHVTRHTRLEEVQIFMDLRMNVGNTRFRSWTQSPKVNTTQSDLPNGSEWAVSARAAVGKRPFLHSSSLEFYLFLSPLGQQHVNLGRESIKACQNKWLRFTKISPMTPCSIILKFLPVEFQAVLCQEWPFWLRSPSRLCGISTISCPQTGLINPYRVCGKHANINYSFLSNRRALWGSYHV